jgi:hypothetical protein
MSDAPKVEEPVVPAAEAPAAEPVVEEPAVEAATEMAAPATEETAAAAEVKPVEEGVLGYKGPGLLKYVFTSPSLHDPVFPCNGASDLQIHHPVLASYVD